MKDIRFPPVRAPQQKVSRLPFRHRRRSDDPDVLVMGDRGCRYDPVAREEYGSRAREMQEILPFRFRQVPDEIDPRTRGT